MESRTKRVAARKGTSDDSTKDMDDVPKKPAATARTARNKAPPAALAGGDYVTVPPKAKGTASKVMVPKGKVKVEEPKKEPEDSGGEEMDTTGSSQEPSESSKLPTKSTPHPTRMDFSSSSENSEDDKKEEEEPVKKKGTKKAAATATKGKVGTKKADAVEDKNMDVEENIDEFKDEEVEKPEEPAKKTKLTKKAPVKPKVGSKRAAPPSSPKADQDFDVIVSDEAGTQEKGKKTTAAKKGQVKSKQVVPKKTGTKSTEVADEESGSNEDDEVVKPEPKGRTMKVATRGGPKGKKPASDEDKDEPAQEKPSGKGPKAAAKASSKEVIAEKKPVRGKALQAKTEQAADASFSNSSADIVHASSDEGDHGENEQISMDTSLEELAADLGVTGIKKQKKPVAVKTSSLAKDAKSEVLKPDSTVKSLPSSGDEAQVISDSEQSGSGSDNKENNLDVVMDNLEIISEESDAPENVPAVEAEPEPEPPKKRAAANRKKLENATASKPKAAPRGAKNHTLPATLESAESATSASDTKKTLLSRKSYATRSKAKAKAGTTASVTAAATKTKK